MILVVCVSDRFALKTLPLLVICDSPLNVCWTILWAVPRSLKATVLTISIIKLLAGKFDDLKREMMTNTVNVSRDFFRVKEGFATWFSLYLLISLELYNI